MPIIDSAARRLTRAFINLDQLTHNLRLTINYEIVTGISHRVPRVAVENGAG